MLESDDPNDLAGTENWDAKNCLEMIFRQISEDLKAWVIRRIGSNRDRFTVFCYPASNTLSDSHPQTANNICMWIL